MGYNVKITRKARIWDRAGPKISTQEWTAYVSTHTWLRWRRDNADSPFDGVDAFDVDGKHVGVLGLDEYGHIDAKNPSPELMERMLEIAGDLNAGVIGDEGELYISARGFPEDAISLIDDPTNTANVLKAPSRETIEAYREAVIAVRSADIKNSEYQRSGRKAKRQ